MTRTVGIIGSGIGALAAGIRLLAAGLKVTLFEARPVAGGKSSGVNVEGYFLDSAPTILRMPHLFADLFRSAGLALEEEFPIRMISPHYRIFKDKSHYLDLSTEQDKVCENIASFSVKDAAQFPEFLERTKTIYRENLTPPPKEQAARQLEFLFRAKKYLPMQASVAQETARFFQDPFIQQAFSFRPLLFGRNPFSEHHRNLMLLAIEQQWGIFSVPGGFHQLIRKLTEQFQNLGGQLALNTRVEQIILQQRKAQIFRLQSGKQLHFDTVISNLSPFQTQWLLPEKNKIKTNQFRNASSFLQLHILFQTGNEVLQPHTIFTTKNYEKFIQQVFHDSRLPEDPWLYLHFPSAISQQLQPLIIITPVPPTYAGINWDQSIFPFRNRIIQKVDALVPDINQRIHFERISTPIFFEEEYSLPGGSPLLPSIQRGISNLFYVGDNTWSGLGLIAALSSAEEVARAILQDPAPMV